MTARVFSPKGAGPWLFGRDVDLLVFGGSAALSFALLATGWAAGLLDAGVPDWTWLACVVAVDVAHVWSTMFRVYLDGAELRRRPLLYFGAPVLCWGVGAMAHAVSPATFWTLIAYVAVFHFVRQQWGWVALYRRRAGETDPVDRWLDTIAIYAATLFPLLWWHGHLPRRFVWFVQDDFVAGLAAPLTDALEPAYWVVLAAFIGRQLWLRWNGRAVNHGKVLVVLTTWACWWVGIMALDSDFAFTVTNVLIHGIPYMALTYRYGRARADRSPKSALARILRGGLVAFVAFVVLAALFEELLWDRYVWHDREWLFGAGAETSGLALALLVPLLALPQTVHYVLDGFVWRVRHNPELAKAL